MYSIEVFIGIDIGGSHISIGFIDQTGQVIDTTQIVQDANNLIPDELIRLITNSINERKDKNWLICSMGIGCPGQCKNGVIIAASNLPLFHNFPIVDKLSSVFSSIPILLLNDADAAISAEVWGKLSRDNYKNYRNIAMITLGTGIGCGLILENALYQGSNGLVEAGHMIVSNISSGRKCGCGQIGCVEAYSSAKSTAIRMMELDNLSINSSGSSSDFNARDVFNRYLDNDENAIKIIDETADHLAVLCLNLCRVVDPDVIILSGGLAKAGDPLLQLIQSKLKDKSWTILPTDVKLVMARSILDGGIIGAALAAKMLLTKQQTALQNAKESVNKITSASHFLEDDTNTFKVAIEGNNSNIAWSKVEKAFLHRSEHLSSYPTERVPTIEVTNIYELGKIVSQRFIEWVKVNPHGVVALPTGRTPEFFIKTIEKYKSQWCSEEVQSEIKEYGALELGTPFPETKNLHFVMLDEFFPMHSSHRNSFCRYIRTYYVSLLDILPENVLTFDLVSEGVLSSEEMDAFQDPVIDITLLHRDPLNEMESKLKAILLKVSAYCDSYESKVAAWGGIGFFLGGIGPDGHIAFNQQNTDLNSKTRLVNFNYPSAAQAAGDLGGIEISRGKAAITIGMHTITANPKATIIIMAAGEGKASVVRAALEDPQDRERPASALHGHAGARFYITHGAAGMLTARKTLRMANTSTENAVQWALAHSAGITYSGGASPALSVNPPKDYLILESYLYEQSMRLNTPVHELNPTLLASTYTSIGCPKALQDPLTCCALVACAARRLREKVEAGLIASEATGKSIVHTAPHHDDIMLSYHAAMHGLLGRSLQPNPAATTTTLAHSNSNSRMLRSSSFDLITGNAVATLPTLGEAQGGNVNYFACLTSGFHSVNESFLLQQCQAVVEVIQHSENGGFSTFLELAVRAGEMNKDYDDLMISFHTAFYTKDLKEQDYIEHVIFLRKICEVWNISLTLPYNQLINALKDKVYWLLNEYLPNHNPGDNIPKDIQILKGCMRETEEDRVWACSRMPNNRVIHLRSKFYTDDFFTPMPSLEDDAMPMANLLKAKQPHIITVAFDPEGTGPDTHYKVLLVVAASLRLVLSKRELHTANPLVWGYRNVWFEFTPSDATLMIPVYSEDLDLMHDIFMSSFTTQKAASFPSPYHDGPFSSLAAQIQRNQKDLLYTLLGVDYFQNHLNERIRNCGGFVFIKAMYAEKFLQEVEQLRSKFENKTD